MPPGPLLLLLTWVPGSLLAVAIPHGLTRRVALCAAPALTLGMVGTTMGWLALARLPNGVWPVGGTVLGLSLLCALARLTLLATRWHDGERRTWPPRPGGRWPDDMIRRVAGHVTRRWRDKLGLAVSAAAASVWGWRELGGLATPPGWDAMNHAILARGILASNSSVVPTVCVTGTVHPVTACDFYPLAPHILWDLATVMSGSRLSQVMLAWVAVVGPVSLVVGVYACVRVAGAHPAVGAAAACSTLVVGPVWSMLITGRLTAQTGAALVPAAALLTALAIRGGGWRAPALAAVGVTGLALSHTYDVLSLVPLTVLLAVLLGRWRPTVRHLGTVVATGLVVTLLTLGPQLRGLAGAGGERGFQEPRHVGHLAASVQAWLSGLHWWPAGYIVPFGVRTPPPLPGAVHAFEVASVLLALASLGAFGIRRAQWARPWVVLWLLVSVVGVWTDTFRGPVRDAVSALWYGSAARLWWIAMPVYGIVVVAGSCVLGLAAAGLARALLRRPRWHTLYAAAPVGAAVVTAVLLTSLAASPGAWQPARATLHQVTPDPRGFDEAMRWLAHHTPPGDAVADDLHRDFVPWAYGDYGVGLHFGLVPLAGTQIPDWVDRELVWHYLTRREPDEVADAPDPAAEAAEDACLVQHYRVHFVVVGATTMPDGRPDYRLADVDSSPRLRLVHTVGGFRIYLVLRSMADCPRAADHLSNG